MFEAIFFDMDGVTIDSEPQWQRSETQLMARFGYKWSDEDQAHCVGGPLTRVGEYMSVLSGSNLDGLWFMNELIRIQMEAMTAGVPLLPGVEGLIDDARSMDIPVGLVSASPRSIIDAVLVGLPENLFDFTISSDDVENTKPHPDPYLKASQLASVDISRALVIEDSKTGIASARSSGAFVLAVPHYFTMQEEERLRVLPNLEGITVKSLYQLFN